MVKNPSTSRRVVWLHLSDLHMCKSRAGYDSTRILHTLLQDLQKVSAQWNLHPDFLFFTGDLIFGESQGQDNITKQFIDAEHFLASVRSAFSPAIPAENVFLVPGNHDVQRSEVTEDQVEWLKAADSHKIHAMITMGNKQWNRYMERLRAFGDFVRHNYPHSQNDPERQTFAVKREVRGIGVGIAGLNSAWSCSGDKEKGKIWLAGHWQLGQLKTAIGNPELSIAMMHHPLSWLHEEERDYDLSRHIEREFSIHLHGHEHDDWVVPSRDTGHVRVAAGACYYHSEKRNGYNIASFNLDSRSLSIWLRKYDPQGGGWVPNAISGKTDDSGCWTIHNLKASIETEAEQITASKILPPQPKNQSQVLTGEEACDVFLAAPMASLVPSEYRRHQKEISRLAKTIRQYCGLSQVFCPAESISSPNEFDPPDLSVRRGLKAIKKARYFVMVYGSNKLSSIVVEAGFALALEIPSLYFVQKGKELPFLLKAASQEFHDVKTYEYKDLPDVIRHLKEYGAQIFRDLARVRENPRKND